MVDEKALVLAWHLVRIIGEDQKGWRPRAYLGCIVHFYMVSLGYWGGAPHEGFLQYAVQLASSDFQ